MSLEGRYEPGNLAPRSPEMEHVDRFDAPAEDDAQLGAFLEELEQARAGGPSFVDMSQFAPRRLAELVAHGARPMLTYHVVQLPSGELRTLGSIHTPRPDQETQPEEWDAAQRGITVAHLALLDTVRRAMDRVHGAGHTAQQLFLMAANPELADAVHFDVGPSVDEIPEPRRAGEDPGLRGAIGDGGPGQP